MDFTSYHVWKFEAREYRWRGGTTINIYESSSYEPSWEIDCFTLQPGGHAPTQEQVEQSVIEHETELRG
jgi:hypothetical protein